MKCYNLVLISSPNADLNFRFSPSLNCHVADPISCPSFSLSPGSLNSLIPLTHSLSLSLSHSSLSLSLSLLLPRFEPTTTHAPIYTPTPPTTQHHYRHCGLSLSPSLVSVEISEAQKSRASSGEPCELRARFWPIMSITRQSKVRNLSLSPPPPISWLNCALVC